MFKPQNTVLYATRRQKNLVLCPLLQVKVSIQGCSCPLPTLSYTPILQYFAIQRLIFSASPKNPSEGEKCCQNRGIPNECFGFCTPVSTAELLRNSLVHTCNEVFDSITECRNLGKGTFWPFCYSFYTH